VSDIHLRDVTGEDLPILYEHQRDPEATRMAAFAARDRDAFMAHWTTRILADETVLKRTVLVDGEIAGNLVSFGPPDERLVGYWLGRKWWGRGVATAALTAFLREEATRPLYAHVAEHNTGSIRVLEKCGFTFVREAHVSDEAGDVDERIYELRAGEAPRRSALPQTQTARSARRMFPPTTFEMCSSE
jgi:RimJ/RimL family protein N-acetyltransferase